MLVKEVSVIPRSITINFLLSTVLFLKILRSNHDPSREKRVCTRPWRGSYHQPCVLRMISFLENNLRASASACGRGQEVDLCESDDLPIISCICHQVVANSVACLMSNVTFFNNTCI